MLRESRHNRMRALAATALSITLATSLCPAVAIAAPVEGEGDTDIPFVPETSASYQRIMEETGDYVFIHTPQPSVSQIGGDWAVFGLARSGYALDSAYKAAYEARVRSVLEASGGVLEGDRKYTEYARVAIGLSSIGADVEHIGGYDLLEKLADFDKVVSQGINGPCFALIAFDARDYAIPAEPNGKTTATRSLLVDSILDQKLPQGGWSLDNRLGAVPESDVTAMAIQALAPYYLGEKSSEIDAQTSLKVKAAVEEGIEVLSHLQNGEGAFANGGTVNAESCAQVVVALASIGIDPENDARFVKNGSSALDALCAFSVSGGGFSHVKHGKVDPMASEQGLYALAAFARFEHGDNRLYDMTEEPTAAAKAERVDAMIAALGDPFSVELSDQADIRAARAAFERLTPEAKAEVTLLGRLVTAEYSLGALIQCGFNDIDGHWAWEQGWILKASGRGLMNGKYNEATDSYPAFGPDDTLSRATAATIIYRIANPFQTDTSIPGDFAQDSRFPDVEGGKWYTAALNWCFDEGIISGDTSGSTQGCFRPDEWIKREEFAKMLCKLAEYLGVGYAVPDPGAVVASFPDADAISPWALEYIAWCVDAELMNGKTDTGKLDPLGNATRAEAAKLIVCEAEIVDAQWL